MTRTALLLTSMALGTLLACVVALLAGENHAQAAFPGANGKIVFASDGTTGTGVNNPTGDDEIFTMNKDGTGKTQLTDNTADDDSPSFSADGRYVVFTSDRDGNKEILRDGLGRHR